MHLKIVQLGETVLRQVGKELSPAQVKSAEIQQLIEWMRNTMYDAPGVGLAAPQVGVPLQLAVIEDKAEYGKGMSAEALEARERKPVPFHVLVNPKLTLLGEPTVEFFEGCLSLAGATAVVPRARQARVECLDHTGKPRTIEASGWYARILQHEIDHLHGTIYIDRMYARTFMEMENFNRFWKEKSIAEVQKLLRYK